MEGLKYDKETKIISMPDEDFEIYPKGLGSFCYERMKKYSNNVAQIDVRTDIKDLYSSLLQRCIRVAIELKNRGIKKGDVISIYTENHINLVVPVIASQFIGAICAPLDTNLIPVDVKHLLNISAPKIIFASTKGIEFLQYCLPENATTTIISFDESDKYEKFSEWLEPKINENDFQVYESKNLEETALILFSSGTTGSPKGICLSHNYLLYHCRNATLPVMLAFNSFYWIATVIMTIGGISKGCCRIITPGFDSEFVWGWLQKYNITYCNMLPSAAMALVRNKPEGIELNLKIITCTGAPISVNQLKMIRDAFPGTLVVSAYGATEMSIVANSFTPEAFKKVGGVGFPVNGCSYKIVNPDTEEVLGLNESGELRVKMKYCMSGYYNMDSSNVWDADGFLKTGDIAYFDEDYYMFIVDRIKEVFRAKGVYFITPTKLEAILDDHPEIISSTVIGLYNEELMDNLPIGFVIIKENSKVTSDEILKWFNAKVDNREHLTGGIRIVKSVPMTVTGKVKRVLLKDMAKNNLI